LKAYELELEDLQQKTDKSKEDYKRIVELIEITEDLEKTLKRFKKILKKEEKVKYVKRDLFKKIIAAWLITVPVAAMLAAMIFFMIKGMML
jgi:PiT family inorganic phosphate transporter